VQVGAIRAPAADGGIKVDDVVTNVRVTKDYPVTSVADYERCCAEMMPGATVEVSGRHAGDSGAAFTVSLTPALLSFASLSGDGRDSQLDHPYPALVRGAL
jgi:hypothetical protein